MEDTSFNDIALAMQNQSKEEHNLFEQESPVQVSEFISKRNTTSVIQNELKEQFQDKCLDDTRD